MKPPHYSYSIWQFIFSLLAILVCWGGALLFTLFGVGVALVQLDVNTISMFLIASAGLACGVLLVPSAYLSGQRVFGWPEWKPPSLPVFLRPTVLILLLPIVLLAGYWISRYPHLALFILPVLHILAVGLPVWWIVYLSIRGLPAGSPQRMWGVFGSGLLLGPSLILFLETAALTIFGVVGMLYIGSRPELLDELSRTMELLSSGQTIMPEEIFKVFGPYLVQPGVILAIISLAAVVVPLIEEAVKPIGVWLLVGFNLSPTAGFVAGALCGAGYALFESLALSSSGEEWAFQVAARIGTAGVHILNTALMGQALVMAWRTGRYARLGLIYLFVVLIHGIWNALTVFTVANSAMVELGIQSSMRFLPAVGTAAPFILVGMGIGTFAGLLWLNSSLRRAYTHEVGAPLKSSAVQQAELSASPVDPPEDDATDPML
jgi:hypothetical protein